MSLLHPRFRLPLWAVIALPLAAYLYRSVARGFDFRPDMPIDLVVLAMFAVIVGLAVWSRSASADERDEETGDQQHDEGDQS